MLLASYTSTRPGLQRPDTRSGVEMLESAGLLTEGRASEILDAPIQPEERPL